MKKNCVNYGHLVIFCKDIRTPCISTSTHEHTQAYDVTPLQQY